MHNCDEDNLVVSNKISQDRKTNVPGDTYVSGGLAEQLHRHIICNLHLHQSNTEGIL